LKSTSLMKIKSLHYGLLASLFILAACGTNLPSTTPVATPTASAVKPIQTDVSPTSNAMACMLVRGQATPEALGANFESRGHTSGPADAAVTIVEFSNYQCPACAFLDSSLRRIRQTHSTDVRLIYINTPSTSKNNDLLAMQAGEAADLQGKYWEMHDLLFDKRAEWSPLSSADFETWSARQAASLGLDETRFLEDYRGKVVAERLQQAVQSAGNQSIVPPILFVNSASPYTGQVDFPSLDTVVRMEALEAHQFSACPAWVIDPHKQYIATLRIDKGDATIQLFADKAPQAVNNFVFLARSGWYDGNTFYRVIPDVLAQTGDPSGTGIGNPGYFFATEITAGLHFNQPGMVAMDNNGLNTNGSRFFITLGPAPDMEGQYTIIGQVLSGLDGLKKLSPRDAKPGEDLPAGDKLIQVTIEEH